MAMDFPVSTVDRLSIFPEEAASAAALMELTGGLGCGDDDSANGSPGGCGRGFWSWFIWADAERRYVQRGENCSWGGAAISGFSESEGDNVEALNQAEVEAHFNNDQEAVIQDRTKSGDGGSAQSTGKVDPQAPWWTKRMIVGNQPPDRAPCPERVGALEQTIRGYADKLGDHVVELAIGLIFDSLGEAYDFYNLYSWEHGFGISYGKEPSEC